MKLTPDQRRAYQRAYYAAHSEEINAKAKASYWKNVNRVAIRQRAYRQANPEKVKASKKAYRARHTERIKAQRKADRQLHPEKYRRWTKSFALLNPSSRRQSNLKQRAIKAKAFIGDTKAISLWEKSWKAREFCRCHWCRKKVYSVACHVDHVIPLAKGGEHTLENLVISCPNCNFRKRASLPEDFNTTLKQPLLFI